jgi:hypothetical protein
MSAQHSIFAPSSMQRIVQCPGSVGLCQKYPQLEDSHHAREGTAAHWVASEYLKTGVMAQEGTLAPNGFEVTQEMIDGAELYADTIADVVLDDKRIQKNIELPIFIKRIHEHCWGTPDLWFWEDIQKIFDITDYKFGHRPVDPFENYQLISYAVGVLETCGIDGLKEMDIRVRMRIVQPRSFHKDGPVRTWTVPASDLRGYMNTAKYACGKALMPDAPTKTGPECDDCSARHVCTTLQAQAMRGVDMSGDNVPHELTPAAVSGELRVLWHAREAMNARISGLEEHALHSIRQGVQIPGLSIETGNGREVWNCPVEQVETLGDMMGVQLRKPKVVTPKQAIKAGMDPKAIESMVTKRSGEAKLVPTDLRKIQQAFK